MSNRSHRARPRVPPPLGRAIVAAAVLLAGASAAGAAGDAGTGPNLWDEDHLLTSRERAAVVQVLATQAAESGSPLSILLVPRLPRHQSIEELARQAFAARALDAPGPPRVLLAVARHERRAAIETGLGPAGIVPEIDARHIVRRLESRLGGHGLASALEEAARAAGASARATAERRRPSPPDPLEQPAPASQIAPAADVTEPRPRAVPGPTGKRPGGPGEAPAPEGGRHGRSLLPSAGLLAAAAVIGLALRNRRRLAQERAELARRAPADRPAKGGTAVKTIGDRPMS